MTRRAPGGRCEEERAMIPGFSFALLLLVLPLSLWDPLLPPGSFKWQLKGQPHVSPDSHCGGPRNPELTFQEGGSCLPGICSHSEDPLHILLPPGPLSCLFFVFFIFLFLPSNRTLPPEQGVGLLICLLPLCPQMQTLFSFLQSPAQSPCPPCFSLRTSPWLLRTSSNL